MDIVTYVKFHAHPVEYLDGWWKYEDEYDNDLYVPVDTVRCWICRGRGETVDAFATDDEPEYEDCDECNGEGYIDKPVYHMAMYADEYVSYRRQERYLYRRYGCMPKRIVDYWQPA